MKSKVCAWSVLCMVALCACALGSHPPPAPPRTTNVKLAISSVELANGLRVVLVQDPRASEVQVTMRYQVGSIDDPAGQEGVAHLVEHLMFQQVLGNQSLFARLEGIATHFNASTTFDATTYVQRTDVSHLEEVLSIEAVRLGFRCTTITDSVFVREREVVINELRQRDGATEILSAIYKGLYPAGHPYQRYIAGDVTTVGGISRDQACAFADAHYGPRNAVLVISGALTAQRAEGALARFIARVAKRAVTPPSPAPAVEAKARQLEASVPMDDEALLIAWPLPPDPELRAKVRAIAAQTRAAIDGEVLGRVLPIELGEGRAAMIGVLVLPSTDETLDSVREAATRGIGSVPNAFRDRSPMGKILFDQIQQTAIYDLFATLEEGGDRDTRLAAYVLAGRDPSVAVGAEIAALREMTASEAAQIAREVLGNDRATVVVLEPRERKKSGTAVRLQAAIHDLGQRRDSPDPDEALRPLTTTLATPGSGLMRTRVLPNGLKVVLLPLTSVPTVDMRLVFGTGTADEPAAKRGVALVAAHALAWDLRFLNDLLGFAAAGGTSLVDVGTDHTAFAAHGLDMHLDYLLAGLRRWIREGRYDGGAAAAVMALRQESKKSTDEGALTDAWRAALFGAHPYVHAGLVRHASETLSSEDARRFRAAHYAPDNATLVIAGGFDAALADRWIDYLFSDWTGHAEPRSSQRASFQPASLALVEPRTQVHLQIAVPATEDRRAEQLVAAAMLQRIVDDVRHELGASYGLSAQLAEQRLATNYLIGGAVDAARAHDAVALLRTRLERLRTDKDAAARSFVSARKQVLLHLASISGSAAEIAAQVARDIELGRPPMSALETAAAVQRLTIEHMTPTLAELDLSRAVVLMRGPLTEIDHAFAVLGRTPTYVKADPSENDRKETAAALTDDSSPAAPLYTSDLEDSLTEQGPPSRLTLQLTPGYSYASLGERGVTGFDLAGHVGYRLQRTSSLGLQLSIGKVSGTYNRGRLGEYVFDPAPLEVMPVSIAGFLQASGYDRLHGAVLLGVHYDRVTDDGTAVWRRAFTLGLEGAVDLAAFDQHRLAIYLRLEGQPLADESYASLTLGLGYRM
ncbi:MAG: Peptidase, family [Myxococcales bacterium]|nr:Peptidase, family [Myxococcales bacterium]